MGCKTSTFPLPCREVPAQALAMLISRAQARDSERSVAAITRPSNSASATHIDSVPSNRPPFDRMWFSRNSSVVRHPARSSHLRSSCRNVERCQRMCEARSIRSLESSGLAMASTVRQIACEQQDGKPCDFDVVDHVDSLWTSPLRCGRPPCTHSIERRCWCRRMVPDRDAKPADVHAAAINLIETNAPGSRQTDTILASSLALTSCGAQVSRPISE
jgi:hypothetical protein